MDSIREVILWSEGDVREVYEATSDRRRRPIGFGADEAPIVVFRPILDVADKWVNDEDGVIVVVERGEDFAKLLQLVFRHLLCLLEISTIVGYDRRTQ